MAGITIAATLTRDNQTARLRVAEFLNGTVFVGLILLLAVTAIPYGTVEPWWKAAFVSAVFMICIIALFETLVTGEWNLNGSRGILLSMLALSGFAFVQTIRLSSGSPDPTVAALAPWNAISADPYQTRFFVLQFLALTTCTGLLYRYGNTEKRISLLIHAVIGIAIASAIFGMLRQTLQHQPGFVLPRTMPGQGYGQFINKNHFAFLMEPALGLGLGMGLVSRLNRDRAMVYAALLLPVWTALVLSNSRGGILAMLAQIVVASFLLTGRFANASSARVISWPAQIARSKVVRAAMLGVLVLAIAAGTVWVGGDRLVATLSNAQKDFTENTADYRIGASRNEIWRATLKMFKSHPLFGVGFGGYWVGITRYHDASGVTTPQEAHNDYLELLSSGGVVGLAIGVWFAVAFFRRVRENLASENRFQRSVCFAALLGITGVAVHSLFDFGLHLLINSFVFLILVVIATKRIPADPNEINGVQAGIERYGRNY